MFFFSKKSRHQMHVLSFFLSMDNKRQKRDQQGGSGKLFKAIIGNLDSTDGEFFTDSTNKLNQI